MSSSVTTMSSPPASRRVAYAGSPSSKPHAKPSHISSSLPPIVPPGLSPAATSLANSPTSTSVQSSPDALQARALTSHCPTPLQLPDSALTSPGLQAEPSPQPSKSGLIRRVSRSAMNAPTRFLRHRQSSNNVADRERDQSSGPLVMRRQGSGSNSADPEYPDGIQDLTTFQLPDSILTVPAAAWQEPKGLGIYNLPSSKLPTEQDDGYGIVNRIPKVDKSLQRGTKMAKITGKKRKEFTFVLDPGSVKISWHPSDSTKRLYIDDILEIRKQSQASNYRRELNMPEDCESRWLTIIYTDPNRLKGRPTKTMHLVAPDSQTFDKWIQNLEQIIDNRQRTMQLLASGRQGNYDKILPQLWRREMDKLNPSDVSVSMNKKETIDFIGVQTVCRSLHMDCNRDWLKSSFNEADVRKSGKLTYEEFRNLFSRLKERSELKELYDTLVEPGANGISIYAFSAFLRDVQGVDTTDSAEKWLKVYRDCIRRFGSSPAPDDGGDWGEELTMNLEAFASFLSSPVNDTLRTISELPKLDQPLSQYYISSSHNTYLLGRQVAGSSSTEAYVSALKKGCRCVEIDCWDGEDGRPMVTHGHTMTSSVLFQDCISQISKYAFVASEYPLILSLEVHCNPAQQATMRAIMERIFGDKLVRTPLNDSKILPSPEELKHRVLVKVKAHTPGPTPVSVTPAEIDAPISPFGRQRSMSSPQSRPPSMTASDLRLPSPPTLASLDLSTTSNLPSRPSFSSLANSISTTDESDFGTDGNMRHTAKPPKSKIIKTLGDLGVYTSGFRYRSFAFPEAKTYNHVFSLAEGDFENLCGPESRHKMEKHNARYLMRVYPGKKRVWSSNFNPLLCWRRGAQMVALNWQTYDLGMQLNDAMFASDADSRGYVLKPAELRLGNPWDGMDESAGWRKGQKQHIRFSVELISGQQLPRQRKGNPDMVSSPYVEIELLCAEDKKMGIATGEGGQDASQSGAAGIGAPHRRRSRIIENNGYNPAFSETFKLSLETRYPSLVFVRWSIFSSPDGRNPSNNTIPLATFTAKLSDLEQGYRYLPLYDHNGEKLLSTLFCKIMKEQPISVDGFGRDDRDTAEKPGRLRSLTNVLKRTLSSKENKNGTLSRRSSAATGRRQSKEKINDTNEPPSNT